MEKAMQVVEDYIESGKNPSLSLYIVSGLLLLLILVFYYFRLCKPRYVLENVKSSSLWPRLLLVVISHRRKNF